MRRITTLIAVAAIAALSACNGALGGCCKECKNSKPCGDSCISNSQTCSKGSGCACRMLDEDQSPDLPLAGDATTGTTTGS